MTQPKFRSERFGRPDREAWIMLAGAALAGGKSGSQAVEAADDVLQALADRTEPVQDPGRSGED